MLTPDRLAELRHVAEQAVHYAPMSGPWLTFYGMVQPGVVLELLDQIDHLSGLHADGCIQTVEAARAALEEPSYATIRDAVTHEVVGTVSTSPRQSPSALPMCLTPVGCRSGQPCMVSSGCVDDPWKARGRDGM